MVRELSRSFENIREHLEASHVRASANALLSSSCGLLGFTSRPVRKITKTKKAAPKKKKKVSEPQVLLQSAHSMVEHVRHYSVGREAKGASEESAACEEGEEGRRAREEGRTVAEAR